MSRFAVLNESNDYWLFIFSITKFLKRTIDSISSSTWFKYILSCKEFSHRNEESMWIFASRQLHSSGCNLRSDKLNLATTYLFFSLYPATVSCNFLHQIFILWLHLIPYNYIKDSNVNISLWDHNGLLFTISLSYYIFFIYFFLSQPFSISPFRQRLVCHISWFAAFPLQGHGADNAWGKLRGLKSNLANTLTRQCRGRRSSNWY